MHLLVSVRSAEEAASALAGGADVIDAKDPAAGTLGPVAAQVFREMMTSSEFQEFLTLPAYNFID